MISSLANVVFEEEFELFNVEKIEGEFDKSLNTKELLSRGW